MRGFVFVVAFSAMLAAFCVAAQTGFTLKPIPAQGVTNVFQLSDKIYSGSAPEGVVGFAQLQKLGIKTILSVDGSKPDVELAHKYGLHYIHLPHGYDGISTNTQAQLIKAAQSAEGPIFVHCHHGMHRGPTAAAVICMAEDGWSPIQAEAWLKTAGTATNYIGLFETVRQFQPPSAAALAKLPVTFPEVAQVSGLVDTMVAIDDTWDHLKAVRKAEYQVPKNHPDLQPSKEIVILREHFREAQRLPDSVKRGTNFLERLQAAEKSVQKSELLLTQYAAQPTAELRNQLNRDFDALNASCASCHKTFRDRVESGREGR